MLTNERAFSGKDQQEEILLKLKKNFKPQEGRIPTFIFSDEEIYKLEVERIFMKTWNFVSHESEIPGIGDYITRSVAGQSVIVSRGEDNQIRVFVNLCRHRGMKVCRSDLGNTAHFKCPYHGFTYKNNGELAGVPFQKEAYGEDMDKSQLSLHEFKVDIYKGLIFAAWKPTMGLDEFLGDMKWYLDILIGRAEMEILGLPHRFVVKTNWKLAAENLVTDAYHFSHTHKSIFDLGLLPSNPKWALGGYHIHMKNGHGIGLGTGSADAPEVLEEKLWPEYKRNLTKVQAEILAQMRNWHSTVFPNLSLHVSSVVMDGKFISVITMRLWLPKGPDKIEHFQYMLVEKNASPEWKKRVRQAYILNFGSSGMIDQDDSENFVDITQTTSGLFDDDDFYYNVQMGMHKEPINDFPGPGVVYEGKFSEANSRAFYSQWYDLISNH